LPASYLIIFILGDSLKGYFAVKREVCLGSLSAT